MMAKRLLAVIGALLIAGSLGFAQTQSSQTTTTSGTDQTSSTTTKSKKHKNKKSADNTTTDNGSNATSTTGPSSSTNSSSTKGTSGAMTSNASASNAGGADRVWVNKDTKVYHRQGDRWFGKTKNGEYMSESEAQKEGYRPAKEHAKQNSQQ